MEPTEETRMGIKDLVQASGVTRRTVRYYVQRGLLPPPHGAGRGHFYLASHLDVLLRIKDLQSRGLTLDEILASFQAGPGREEAPLPEPPAIELVTRIRVTDGVEILVSPGSEPPRPAQIRALADAAARILGGYGR
jgi:DNA-binding transcriptional MerR regulator